MAYSIVCKKMHRFRILLEDLDLKSRKKGQRLYFLDIIILVQDKVKRKSIKKSIIYPKSQYLAVKVPHSSNVGF